MVIRMQIDYIELLDVTIRGFVSLLTLFLVTKLLGKKQVSELSLFDYVIGISIGNFAAEMTINLDSQFLNGILAVIVFGFVAYIVSILTMKSIHLRRFFMGRPTILIQDGKLLEDGLRVVKFDINDLLEECRGNGYFDISEIAYAVMEANGRISILPKAEYKPATLKDLKIKAEKSSLQANVIIDGHIMQDAVRNMGITNEWLLHELDVHGKKLNDILLATLDRDKKLIFYEKNVNAEVEDVLE